MSWSPRHFLPGRIGGQIAILVVISLIAIHAIITAGIFFSEPRGPISVSGRGPISVGGPGPPGRPESPDQLPSIIRVVDAVAREERPALLARIAPQFPHLQLQPIEPPASEVDDRDPRLMPVAFRLGPEFRVSVLGTNQADRPENGLRVAVRLRDGDWIAATIMQGPFLLRLPGPGAPIGAGVMVTTQGPPPPPPRPWGPIAMTIVFIVISVSLLGFWAARALISPLNQFADAAESFRGDGAIAPLPERGPYEIRVAAQALNRMRERIRQLIDDRTRMLVAVGHDLRTPITRLRLRSEFIEDEALRAPMLRDLDQMQAMIESVLMFLRTGGIRERATPIDVATSLQTICDQFADMGHDVTYCGPDHLIIVASADEIHRAVTNLVDNAVRYGTRTVVRLAEEGSEAKIDVEDDGPGIPDAQKTAMLEPFVRGDAARGMNEKAGFGLGLSIARAVVERHGGSLELVDRQPRGLIVRIVLPKGTSR
jgi:signal transduction histidine kinase